MDILFFQCFKDILLLPKDLNRFFFKNLFYILGAVSHICPCSYLPQSIPPVSGQVRAVVP